MPDAAASSPNTDSAIQLQSRDASAVHIANLRRRLSPLIATDDQLADRLSGGITVSGSGKGSVYVRSGWQSRTAETPLGRMRSRPSTDDERNGWNGVDGNQDPLVQEIGKMLQACEGDIQDLWSHATVKGLMAKRKLKLDEWSEL